MKTTTQLKGKDLINLAIFSLLFFLIFMAVALPTGLLVFLYPFCVGIAIIPCGIVWAYLRAKVPKRFGMIIQGVIFALTAFLLGSGWFVAAGLLAGGILAELLSGVGAYKSMKWDTAGYAAFAVCYNLGMFALILFARDYYFDFCVESGMDAGYMNALIDFFSGPMLLLTSALAAAGAVIGMLLGRRFLKKHFERAGIV
jgi:energy-coupling factor transport system substrate-specific component